MKNPDIETAHLMIRPYQIDDLHEVHRILSQAFGKDKHNNPAPIQARLHIVSDTPRNSTTLVCRRLSSSS